MGYWDHREGRYRIFSDRERKEYGEKKRSEWLSKYVTRSMLIRYYGWIDEAVDEFLKPVKAGTGYAYLRSDVAKIEEREDFRQWISDTRAARKKLPRKKKPVDPNKKQYSKPVNVQPIETRQGVSVYEAACPRCSTVFSFVVSSMNIHRGVAVIFRRCKDCSYDMEVRLSLNKETMRVRLPPKSQSPAAPVALSHSRLKEQDREREDKVKSAQDLAKTELAAIDEELAKLERELEPIERERSRIKEKYIELESRKFGLLKRVDTDRLRGEFHRYWE